MMVIARAAAIVMPMKGRTMNITTDEMTLARIIAAARISNFKKGLRTSLPLMFMRVLMSLLPVVLLTVDNVLLQSLTILYILPLWYAAT